MSVNFNPVSQQHQKRFNSIDALRGIAALYILLYHLALIPNPALYIPKWANPFVHTGGTAVILFFVISSFCLCLSMQNKKQGLFPYKRFYLRRIFRIVPLFYFLIILSLIREKYLSGNTLSLADVLLNISFAFNLVPGKQDGVVWASWILSIQMIFYLIFPLVYRFVNNFWKSIVFFFFTLIVASGYSVFIAYLQIPVAHNYGSFINFSFIHQLPVFALGMCAFFVYDLFIKDSSRSWGAAFTGLAILTYIVLVYGHLIAVFNGIYWQGIIYCLLLIGLLITPIPLFVNRLFCFYGKISYSLYLLHPMLVYFLIPVYRSIYSLHLPATLQYGACLLLTLGPLTLLSYFSYRFIEQPGIDMGNRLIAKIVVR
jgi:peptidoglycan/LPS O-acetylase OafA/YrhL